jgi:hypothetical protein
MKRLSYSNLMHGAPVRQTASAAPSPSHLIESPNASYTLSLILKPMRARTWFGATEVWAGPIGANTIRLTPPGLKHFPQSDIGDRERKVAVASRFDGFEAEFVIGLRQ